MKSVLIALIVLFISLFHVPGANAEWIKIDNFSPYQMCFGDEMNGMAFDYPNAWRTNNGGITWEKILYPNIPDTYQRNISSCIMMSSGKAYIGFNGYTANYSDSTQNHVYVFSTNDFGDTWDKMPLFDFGEMLCEIDPYFSKQGTVRLLSKITSEFLATSFDDCKTWNLSGIPHFTNGISFYDSQTGYAFTTGINYGYLNKTINGGETWIKVENAPVFISPFSHISELIPYSKDVVWIIGEERLFYSNNGGDSWEEKIIKSKVKEDENIFVSQEILRCSPIDETKAIVLTRGIGIHLFLIDMKTGKQYSLDIPEEFLYENYTSSTTFCLIGKRLYINMGFFYIQTDIDEIIENGVEVETEIPVSFTLNPAYPNPFNPSTTISFSIPETSNVNLSVYNLAGQKIATIADKEMTAGYHSFVWNAMDISTGIYFYTLESMGKKLTGKITFLK